VASKQHMKFKLRIPTLFCLCGVQSKSVEILGPDCATETGWRARFVTGDPLSSRAARDTSAAEVSVPASSHTVSDGIDAVMMLTRRDTASLSAVPP